MSIRSDYWDLITEESEKMAELHMKAKLDGGDESSLEWQVSYILYECFAAARAKTLKARDFHHTTKTKIRNLILKASKGELKP